MTISFFSLVGPQISARRSFHFLWVNQRFRTYHHVFVLLPRCARPTLSEVPLVEEIFDDHPDDPIPSHHDPRFPTVLHRLRLPEGPCLLHRMPCHWIPHFVLILL